MSSAAQAGIIGLGTAIGAVGGIASALSKPTVSTQSSLSPLGQMAFSMMAPEIMKEIPGAVSNLGELATKGQDSYGMMDEWSAQRYRGIEMPAIATVNKQLDSSIFKSRYGIDKGLQDRFIGITNDSLSLDRQAMSDTERALQGMMTSADRDRQLGYSSSFNNMMMAPMLSDQGQYYQPEKPNIIGSMGTGLNLASGYTNMMKTLSTGYNNQYGGMSDLSLSPNKSQSGNSWTEAK